MSASTHQAATLIAAHIARHGVTRCPAAIVAPSSAQLSPADIHSHHTRAPVRPRSGPASCMTWQNRDQERLAAEPGAAIAVGMRVRCNERADWPVMTVTAISDGVATLEGGGRVSRIEVVRIFVDRRVRRRMWSVVG